jgi:ABC-type Fe3+ transport system permease subunit
VELSQLFLQCLSLLALVSTTKAMPPTSRQDADHGGQGSSRDARSHPYAKVLCACVCMCSTVCSLPFDVRVNGW